MICTNSYDGWYAVSGRLADAQRRALGRGEIRTLHDRCGNKPMIVTDFGADAMAGVHAQPVEMWSEDYQSDGGIGLVSRRAGRDAPSWSAPIPGPSPISDGAEHLCASAALNLKGVFTRDRRPNLAARTAARRWTGKKTTDWQADLRGAPGASAGRMRLPQGRSASLSAPGGRLGIPMATNRTASWKIGVPGLLRLMKIACAGAAWPSLLRPLAIEPDTKAPAPADLNGGRTMSPAELGVAFFLQMFVILARLSA